ncbi:MAG TPA: enoyl-CoA hydratase/isomerase family protein [Pirellulales bacterium]|nr:enoyl-CoA hydratase/isomerase family protein [Pirellulales bacterium]
MIELEEHGAVTLMRMARGKGNALDHEFLGQLTDALETVEQGPTRAVVITGQGSVFGAGVDLPAIVDGGAEYIRRFFGRMVHAFERLATFPKPLVAAVNGHAIAGGAIIMLACDQRLLARGTARVGLTEIQVGVLFPAWALEIARFATPSAHFPTLILTGRTWQPDQALARGLVDELVEPEQLLDRALEVAAELGTVPTATFSATKRQVRAPLLEAVQRATEADLDADVVEHWCLAETQSRIAEFAARHIKRS